VPNSLYSFFGGSLAGLIAGVIISVIYISQQKVDSKWLTIVVTGFYGLVAGAVMSFLINLGMSRSSKLMNNSPSSKVVGGTVGGALGGILASMIGGLAYADLNDKPISSIQVIVAVGCSTFFITLGVLMPEMKGEWYKRILIIIILVCVAFVTLVITTTLARSLFGKDNGSFLMLVLELGLISGLMSGVQAGSALFVYYRFDKSESVSG
jgi:hypothetical protein